MSTEQETVSLATVLGEIDFLLQELMWCQRKKKDFEDLQERTLQLCQLIFQTKKSYSDINVPFPNKSTQWELKEELLEKHISILQEAREVFSPRLNLFGD